MNDELFAMTCEIIKKTGDEIIMPRFEQQEETDFFTSVQFEVRNILSGALNNIDKTALFTAKGDIPAFYDLTAAANDKKNIWIVNPLDGESGFTKKSNDFAVTAAHMDAGIVDAAWIYLPATKQLLSGQTDKGVFINGEKTAVAEKKHTEIINVSDVYAERAAKEFGIDRTGSAALCYFNIISGKTDGMIIDQKEQPWDHAAGIFLHKLAGGYNGYTDTTPYFPGKSGRSTIVAAANRIEFKKLCSFAGQWEKERKASALHSMLQSYAQSPFAKAKADFERAFDESNGVNIKK